MLAFFLLLLSSIASFAFGAIPDQIHVAYTGVSGQLSVDFVSSSFDGNVSWGISKTSLTNTNTTSSFNFTTIGILHQGLMIFDVAAGQKGYYQVSSGGESSAIFEVTPIVGAAEKFAIFGDFGYKSDVCMNDLIQEAAAGSFDSVMHVGDFAYDFEESSRCGTVSCVGNGFMNLMQGYAATHPVMPSAGNHEACGGCPASPINPDTKGNFSEYRSRLHSVTLFAGANSGSNSNIYYSFNQGLTHFIVFSAEAYIYAVDKTFLANQLAFMKKDLAAVNRKITPWVVALVHKDWTMETAAFNDFSPILEKGGVDILFCGHVHYYRRYAPYDSITGTIDSASVSADGKTYTNPKYMVVIITGAPGNREGDHNCDAVTSPALTCTQNHGYLIFSPINETVATSSFHTVRVDGPGPANYTDEVTIITDHRVARA